MTDDATPARSLGLLGATGVGVGAIVGGGVLALAGVAFATAGPGAMLAFTLNGGIALLTALSYAEMSSRFPESGGTYTFARKVLSVEAAFVVGWVVWFASVVAGVLYALGFASYAAAAVRDLWSTFGPPPAILDRRVAHVALAVGAIGVYAVLLTRRAGGGAQWATVGKLLVFAVLIAGGLWALAGRPPGTARARLTPFLSGGATGLLQATGYTFIALQGFDLIAAVAGEVRDPGRTVPRAMFLSLAAALAVYLPFLFVVATVGTAPGETIAAAGARHPDTVIADAARRYLGAPGYWLVVVAAILSMLSALGANLFAASRVAATMARDRTLPHWFARVHPARGTPAAAVTLSALAVAAIALVLPDVAAAGAAASLVFLVSFALAHWTGILARLRARGHPPPFRAPWFPAVPVTGGLACLALAVFQGVTVPAAGLLAAGWLGIGVALYLSLFARRAAVADASAEAFDPELVRSRGRSPFLLVPIANPARTAALVEVAHALSPPGVGRVLLLSVVAPPPAWRPGDAPPQLADAQTILGEALTESFAASLSPEALITVAPRPWAEIGRVFRTYGCASVLLGVGDLMKHALGTNLEELMNTVDSDLVLLRSPPGWRLEGVRRVLVPVGGRRDQSRLRARLLGTLWRKGLRDMTYLGVFSEELPDDVFERARRELVRLVQDEVPGKVPVEAVRAGDVGAEVVRRAAEADLVVLGLQRLSRHQRNFGSLALRIARESSSPLLMISRGG